MLVLCMRAFNQSLPMVQMHTWQGEVWYIQMYRDGDERANRQGALLR